MKNNFLDELKSYLESTSKEQILKDWEQTKEYQNSGPLLETFLEEIAFYHRLPPDSDDINLNIKNPELTSGFSFSNYHNNFKQSYAKSSIFNNRL